MDRMLKRLETSYEKCIKDLESLRAKISSDNYEILLCIFGKLLSNIRGEFRVWL